MNIFTPKIYLTNLLKVYVTYCQSNGLLLKTGSFNNYSFNIFTTNFAKLILKFILVMK